MAAVTGKDFVVFNELHRGDSASVCNGKILNKEIQSRLGDLPDLKSIFKVFHDIQNPNQVLKMRQKFEKELSILWNFRKHKNFSKLICFSTAPLTLVLKFYTLGSLDGYIHHREEIPALVNHKHSFRSMFEISRDIAKALAFMHRNMYVYNNLKPSNVLLDQDAKTFLYAVLTDFQRTQVPNEEEDTAIQDQIPLKFLPYAAPEVINRLGKVGSPLPPLESLVAADVYSFGVLVYEIFCRDKPWAGATKEQITRRVNRGTRPNLDGMYMMMEKDPRVQLIASLVERCWMQAPNERPIMDQVVNEMDIDPGEDKPAEDDDDVEQTFGTE